MKKVIILDTSILCVWLQVPGKDTCCSGRDIITYDKVRAKIEDEIAQGAEFVLPLAAIIETGNHIAQAHGDKHAIINSFANHIKESIDGNIPWVTFTNQLELFSDENLKSALNTWQKTANTGQSLGDALIVEVAKYYSNYGFDVEIYTGDKGLKAYENICDKSQIQVSKPRRRK